MQKVYKVLFVYGPIYTYFISTEIVQVVKADHHFQMVCMFIWPIYMAIGSDMHIRIIDAFIVRRVRRNDGGI